LQNLLSAGVTRVHELLFDFLSNSLTPPCTEMLASDLIVALVDRW
jgi:hypothetical protein